MGRGHGSATWVLAKFALYGLTPKVDRKTKQTYLKPGAELKLREMLAFFRRNEPFRWMPGPYEKAPGW